MNLVTLIGRITADPEVRYTQSGLPVCGFQLAVDRKYKDQAGNRKTDFVRCVAWHKLAELMNQYVRKGYQLAIQGELNQEEYHTKDTGEKRYSWQVVVNELKFLDRGGQGSGEQSGGEPEGSAPPVNADDDLPF